MRRLRGKIWLNIAATLLLAAVISPMADATDTGGTDGSADPAAARTNAPTTQGLTLPGATAATVQASRNPTNLIARVNLSTSPSSTLLQIPIGLASGVYYDTPVAQSESSPSAASKEKAPLSGIVTPGKWTSLLSTVLLVGFVFLRRAS